MKWFFVLRNVGKVKYLVNYHDGRKKNPDGSDFFDVAPFNSFPKMAVFTTSLLREGYEERVDPPTPKGDVSKATVARVVAKCSDLCNVTLIDAAGNEVASHSGYVPDFMPGEHFGDYIELEIELSTGRILNWKKPSKETLAKPRRNQEWETP